MCIRDSEDVVSYLEEITGEKIQAIELGKKVLETNQRWDDKVTTYQEAQQEFQEFIDDFANFTGVFSEPGPPSSQSSLISTHDELTILVNLIYDTTLGFRIWKGQYPRLTNNIPYRINPWQWNIEEAPTPIMWLYFDYYGLQLMTFKATSESYFNYFSGDPVGQNIYLLPDSNFEDGLGVFYSSNEYRFLLNVVRE